MSSQFEINAVGIVRSSRSAPEDDSWDEETSRIEMTSPFDEMSLLGLADFSHCIVVYVFEKATWDDSKMSRHPRGNKDWPEVGIFAQRAKDRPNRLGVTVCQIVKVEGSTVHVAGLDAIDGTPVVDIKPWMDEFDAPRGLGSQFPVGCLVKHPLFGLGTVQAILPRGSVTSARVSFRTVGVKTLVLEYAKLVRV